ncbi:MAG: hypothetical protein ABSB88_11915 [Bryobacteraceae bacterium]
MRALAARAFDEAQPGSLFIASDGFEQTDAGRAGLLVKRSQARCSSRVMGFEQIGAGRAGLRADRRRPRGAVIRLT